MSKKLIFAIVILTCLASTSFADTLHIKPLGIAFEGKHIKDDINNVYFGVNFFKKSGKDYNRFELVLPKTMVSYEIVDVTDNDDADETTIEKLLKQADQWIYTGFPEKAYQRYARAKRLMLDKEENNETLDDEIKKHIYSGLLRFEIDNYFKNINYYSKKKKYVEYLREFARCSDVVKEFQKFLCVKTSQGLKTYEIELQIVMRALLNQKRSRFFKLVNNKLPKSKSALSKILSEIEGLYSDIETIYKTPNQVTAIAELSSFMNTGLEDFTQILKRANINETQIKLFDENKISKIKSSLNDSPLFRYFELFGEVVFSEKKKSIKDLNESLNFYEDIFKKNINHENVGKVSNADVLEFKNANSDLFKEGIKSLDKNEKELYDKINDMRECLGLNPLIIKTNTLQVTAKKYLYILIKLNSISHKGPDGSTPKSRAKNAGWKGENVGENLYRGTKDANNPQDVLTAWFKSLEHLKNIVSKDYDSCGIAQASYNWCMMFGGP